MGATSEVTIAVKLAFPEAGVAFAISVQGPDGDTDERARFHLAVAEIPSGRAVPLNPDASPQLADWVRGYTRWLVRARVTASHDERGIAGHFAGGLTPEQVLQGALDACDMIRQRFEACRQSVLAT